MAISPDGYHRAGVEAVLVYLVARLLGCLTEDDYRALGTLLATVDRQEGVAKPDLGDGIVRARGSLGEP